MATYYETVSCEVSVWEVYIATNYVPECLRLCELWGVYLRGLHSFTNYVPECLRLCKLWGISLRSLLLNLRVISVGVCPRGIACRVARPEGRPGGIVPGHEANILIFTLLGRCLGSHHCVHCQPERSQRKIIYNYKRQPTLNISLRVLGLLGLMQSHSQPERSQRKIIYIINVSLRGHCIKHQLKGC